MPFRAGTDLGDPSQDDWFNGVFNAADFTNPAPGTFANQARNAFRGPGFKNVDLSLCAPRPRIASAMPDATPINSCPTAPLSSSKRRRPRMITERLGVCRFALFHTARGDGESLRRSLSNHNCQAIPPVTPHIKAGRLRAIAVTGDKRVPELPNVPTFTESGLKGFDATAWYGIMAPANTPKDVIASLNGAVNKALADPGVRKRLLDMGAEPAGGTSEQMGDYLRQELAKWGKVIRDAKIKPEGGQ